jgi:CheY-like chemotaxis protein
MDPPETSLRVPGGLGRESPTGPPAIALFPAFPTQRLTRDGDDGPVIRSVLVVDDDPEFRELAGRLLAAIGLTVIGEADCVAAALVAAVELRPAAVLADVELPDGDGVTLAREPAALPWHPRIVLTSINADITTAGEARLAGARAFVVKADLPDAPLARLLGGE